MIKILSKLRPALFQVTASSNAAFRYDLSSACPVLCEGEFDKATLSVFAALGRDELWQFARAIEDMQTAAQVGRTAVLWAIGGSVVLTLRLKDLGQVRGDFLICSKALGQVSSLYGRLDLDQTYLNELAAQCDALLDWRDYDAS